MKSPFRPNHVLRQLRLSLEEDDEGPSPESRRSRDPFCSAVAPPSASTISTNLTEQSSSSSSSSPPFSSGEGPILRLRFLRTFVVDCTALMHLRLDASMARWHARQDATPGTTSSTASSSSQEGRRSSVLEHAQRLFELQRRSVGSPDVVEHVALRRVPTEAIPQLEEYLISSVHRLRSVDFRNTYHKSEWDDFLGSAAMLQHAATVQSLRFPLWCVMPQERLNPFTNLVELELPWCSTIRSVAFCAATLRILCAGDCLNLSDEGLAEATQLEMLNVSSCSHVTSVAPFARSLQYLDASFSCGIDQTALYRQPTPRLQCLLLRWTDRRFLTVAPVAGQLRELHASGGSCHLSADDGISLAAANLVRLNVNDNTCMKRLDMFYGSERLRELAMGGRCRVTFADLNVSCPVPTFPALVRLDLNKNETLRGVLDPPVADRPPLFPNLLELDVSMSNIALVQSTKVLWLNAAYNSLLSDLTPFAASLRHLSARGPYCAIRNQTFCPPSPLLRRTGERSCIPPSKLVVLDLSENGDVCSLEWCSETLEVLVCGSPMCALKGTALMLNQQPVPRASGGGGGGGGGAEEKKTWLPQLWRVDAQTCGCNPNVEKSHLPGRVEQAARECCCCWQLQYPDKDTAIWIRLSI